MKYLVMVMHVQEMPMCQQQIKQVQSRTVPNTSCYPMQSCSFPNYVPKSTGAITEASVVTQGLICSQTDMSSSIKTKLF